MAFWGRFDGDGADRLTACGQAFEYYLYNLDWGAIKKEGLLATTAESRCRTQLNTNSRVSVLSDKTYMAQSKSGTHSFHADFWMVL